MANDYAALKARIASDLKRSDLTSDIADAILDAIRDHGAERFWFNDFEIYSFNTVIGTEEYTLSAVAPIDEIIKIDWVRAVIGSSFRRIDFLTTDQQAELYFTSIPLPTGQPLYYTVYGPKIQLYPVPNAIYSIGIASHYRLTPLSADSDSNYWTNQAKNLIRYSVLKRLYAYPIRNTDQAQVATAAETLELEYLRRETDRRKRTGQMAPYYG